MMTYTVYVNVVVALPQRTAAVSAGAGLYTSEALQVNTTISQEAEIRNCLVQQHSCYRDCC